MALISVDDGNCSRIGRICHYNIVVSSQDENAIIIYHSNEKACSRYFSFYMMTAEEDTECLLVNESNPQKTDREKTNRFHKSIKAR